MSEYRELLLGCGHDRIKRYVAVAQHARGWRSPKGPVTLDLNTDVQPDLYCDLNQVPPWHFFPRDIPDSPEYEGIDGTRRLYAQGFEAEADYWDEIHAYNVLEHLGRQGDAHSFFDHFTEVWRILKPGGYLVAEVPSRFSGNLWGDPGHTRAIVPESLVFLSQEQYVLQLEGPPSTRTTMSDYRFMYHADLELVECHDTRRDHFVFVLQAIKPSRWVLKK